MTLTYRTRRRLSGFFRVLVIGLAVFAVCWSLWFLWLARYVVYTADGAVLRLDQPYTYQDGEVAVPPEIETVAIHYNEGSDKVNTSSELGQIYGYYATTSMLLDSVENVDNAVQKLPVGSAVMLDLKSIYGNFYYNTGISGAPVADQIDSAAIDRLIRNLVASDYYLIARVPAFRDRAYGLANPNYGLPTSGGYLWDDDQSCYWLDPTSNGTLNYLINIATELRNLGFDEVVFTEFRFPDTDKIVFKSHLSRSDAVAQAAAILVQSCATESFAVSFQTDDQNFPLPEGRSRMYLTDVSAMKAQAVMDAVNVRVKESQPVFLTVTFDTRFDICSVMLILSGIK
jgi:hypothetical protein